MTRADFWCRVLGWLQIAVGAVFAFTVLFLWELALKIFMIEDIPGLSFLVWVFVVIAAVPMLLSGLLTVIFANTVEQTREGLRGQSKPVLRTVMALSGLWSAGLVGFAGFTLPPVGFVGLLSLATTGIAIMGPDWTADLFGQKVSQA